jgi:hypothetical protein
MRPSDTAQDSDVHARRASRIHLLFFCSMAFIELRRRYLHERHKRDVPHKQYTESHTPVHKPGGESEMAEGAGGWRQEGDDDCWASLKARPCDSFCCALCRRRRSCSSRTCACKHQLWLVSPPSFEREKRTCLSVFSYLVNFPHHEASFIWHISFFVLFSFVYASNYRIGGGFHRCFHRYFHRSS